MPPRNKQHDEQQRQLAADILAALLGRDSTFQIRDEAERIHLVMRRRQILEALQPRRGLKPLPPEKAREWAEIFAGWRDRHDTTATGIDTLVREWLGEQHRPQREFASVKKRYQRWEAKQPPVNRK